VFQQYFYWIFCALSTITIGSLYYDFTTYYFKSESYIQYVVLMFGPFATYYSIRLHISTNFYHIK